ncbi:unnamed protein product, partial [Rotaria sp. Silwood2]
MDDAVWILRHLRESFNISDNYEQQRLMTMLPSDWGRDRIANWFDGSKHQARQSIQLRTTSGVLSFPEDRRGNKSLDSQVELAVHNFYISDEISRETSNKKQIIHPPPSRIPVPLRFLHLTIGETYEQFKLKYPNMEINRSKFYSLRLTWVREKTPHDTCMCIYHENAALVLQGISKSFHRLLTLKQLVEQTVCVLPTEQCYYRRCPDCYHLKVSNILSDGIDVEIQDEASWSIWKKINLRYDRWNQLSSRESSPWIINDNSLDFIEFIQLFKSFYFHCRRDLKDLFDKFASEINIEQDYTIKEQYKYDLLDIQRHLTGLITRNIIENKDDNNKNRIYDMMARSSIPCYAISTHIRHNYLIDIDLFKLFLLEHQKEDKHYNDIIQIIY